MELPTGDDIRTARKEKGLTQSELAERAGVSQPLIARIESDDVDPTIDTLYAVVSALNDSASGLEQEEVTMSMPSVLKDARTRTGYTQGELAEVAGVSQPLISRIERQDVNPRTSTLRELFSHLDLQTDSVSKKSPTQPTAKSDLIEKIEWEFENVEGMSGSNTERPRLNEEDDLCPECSSDLSVYSSPSYCPDCGTEL